MYGASREQLRNTIVNAWLKYRQQAAMQPLEQQIALIVGRHPEYHSMLEKPGAAFGEFSDDTGSVNPFLHIAMHIAVDEQYSTNRPTGFTRLYDDLIARFANEHELQHGVMEILGQILWEAQREGRIPDQDAYLSRMRRQLAGRQD